MKKTYINPAMVIVKLRARQQMLSGSQVGVGVAYREDDAVLGRDFDFDDEE